MTNMTQPIGVKERIHMLDVIRGFALLGILLMNIEFFQRPLTAMMFGFDTSLTGLDHSVGWTVFTFVQGKFYTMFSLLFGIGFVIFYDRAKQNHDHPRWLFFRRLLVLALFGLVHMVFIWGGDILLTYAIVGLLLLLFINSSAGRLWKWGLALFLLPVAMFWLGAVSMHFAMQSPEFAQQTLADQQQMQDTAMALISNAEQAYATGSYSEVLAARLAEVNMLYGGGGAIFFFPTVLGIFLIGASFARSGVFTSFEKRPTAYKNLLRWGLIFGLPSALYVGFYGTDIEMMMPSLDSALAFTLMQVANFGLCFAYMAIIALALRQAQRNKRQHWLQNLAPAGRMALTNYLFHSLFFTSLFYGYAVGLYGEYGRATTTALAVIVWLAQIPFSKWWLSRFKYGPCEWLWRCATYGKLFAFK
ncbi:DUF418 domain-containing protein [Pseudidiomarina sp. 1APP75-32.1]|uniref:DUF418 domain-containing protein n=1 Tax=Pseudidiomarina terrestris TaxID=2820060 RepID=A0AAW7QZ26_9GAMM|nr:MULTISPECIES: DUF418 domain-containing protein [unclassified Pseudidiomarina]MDN7124125.1 DUF418 domain-containing protein [Pseudidiomarina sp. 1APP75-32.1]MDN7128382.1 DUF418 domain-containing protein [Pseudidiomarina sp. 1APR75-15]MEA3586872.1 DUF418 domain-containing protein [Pseudidiomarina sp. 1APP75-27a]